MAKSTPYSDQRGISEKFFGQTSTLGKVMKTKGLITRNFHSKRLSQA